MDNFIVSIDTLLITDITIMYSKQRPTATR